MIAIVLEVEIFIDGLTVGRPLHVVLDDAQPLDVLVGSTYTESPNIAYVRVDKTLHLIQ